MTTPPTPAGWYPDPDGSGGQRYWDGSTWTEHRAPAIPPPATPARPAAPAPPAAPEPPASEQPTAVVSLPPTPTGERVGAHRAPDPEDERAAGPAPGPTAPVEQPTTPVTYSPPSAEETRPVPTPPAAFSDVPGARAPEPATYGAPPGPPLGGPPPTPAGEPSVPGDNRQLILRFGVACAALLAVLVVVVIYAVFIHKDDSVQIGASDGTTTSAAKTTAPTATETQSVTESPTTAAGSGQATDSGITFAVTGVETAATVQSQDAPVEKTAQGEFVIVHLTVLNSGDAPTTFLGTLQKLKAGGTTYSIDDEATFYLNGGLAELNPGDQADVAVAFDVPPGTTPEAIELHGDPISSGVEIPLS